MSAERSGPDPESPAVTNGGPAQRRPGGAGRPHAAGAGDGGGGVEAGGTAGPGPRASGGARAGGGAGDVSRGSEDRPSRHRRRESWSPQNYYGIPPVKRAPFVKEYIPTYFWLGGIAAGAWLVTTAEDVAGENDRAVVRVGRYLTTGTLLGGTWLLIIDLGRPERFLKMLRVFRARSAMSLGSWGLAGFGALSGVTAVLQAAEDGWLGDEAENFLVMHMVKASKGPIGRMLHMVGLPLALFVGSYTGVLLASTSTPAWARRRLLIGPYFVASALSTGAAAVGLALRLLDELRPGVGRRLALAETISLGSELALVAADRMVSRDLPAVHDEPRSHSLLRAAAIGAGVVLPLAINLFEAVRSEDEPSPAERLGRRLARAAGSDDADVERGRGTGWGLGLVAAGLTLAGGLALRWLAVHEGLRSADTAEDTWAHTRDVRRQFGPGGEPVEER